MCRGHESVVLNMTRILKAVCMALALLLCCGCTAEAANAAPAPENELTVFSLGESGTVRRAVIEFQKENPAMTVRYQIGDQSPLPREETLRALRNELEKGRGPDVLILDGMDAAVYEGRLADPGTPDPQCFPNIVEAGRRDGKQYAIPMRFLPPLSVEVLGDIYSSQGTPDGADALRELLLTAWSPSVNNAPDRPMDRELAVTATGTIQPTLFTAVTDGPRQEQARRFVAGMLTEFVQQGDFGEGLPVRMDVFAEIVETPSSHIRLVTDLKALFLAQKAAGPPAMGTVDFLNGKADNL